jgi:hypothetical protein
MSFSFYLRQVPEVSLKDTLAAVAIPNLVVDCDVPKQGWPALAHIHQDRVSVRSIETAFEKGSLQVRIMSASSLDDYSLAAALVDAVATRHGVQVESEDSEPLALADWRARYGGEWQREQCDALLDMVVRMYQKDKETMRMFGTRAEFQVGRRVMEPLLLDPANLQERFFAAFRRRNYLEHEDVYGPSLMRVRVKQSGKDAILAVLGPGVTTALSTEAGFVVLTDMKESLNLPFDDFVAAAGDALTWIDDGTALTPSYAPEAWQRLVAAARPKAVKDFAERPDLLREPEAKAQASAATTTADEAKDELGLTESQWTAIAAAPVIVFMLVAAADGQVDAREVTAFGKKLTASLAGGGRVMKGAAARALPNLALLTEKLAESGVEGMANLLVAARQMVDETVGRGEGHRFASALYALGESVASASGGGFFGLGSKISAEERVILDGLKKLLRIP